MIEIFGKKYRAASNIFVETIEDSDLVYPSPLSLCATIEDEQKHLKNELKFKFSSYYDSILVLDFQFSIFMYLLSYDYRIETLYIDKIEKKEVNNEMGGYGGTYSFDNMDVLINFGEDEIYDRYKKTAV